MDNIQSLYKAIGEGDTKMVELAAPKINVNGPFPEKKIERKHRGLTPLGFACTEDKLDNIQILVENGADINKPGNVLTEMIPAMICIQNGHMAALELCLRLHSNMDICDKYGRTVLHHAAAEKSKEYIDFLIPRSSEPYKKDKYGNTALSISSFKGLPGHVASLLAIPLADYNVRNASNQTAIHLCILGYKNECEDRFLQTINKDKSNGNSKGLHASKMADYLKCLNFLLAKTCDPHVIDSENMAALDYVQESISQGYDMSEFVDVLIGNDADPLRYKKELEKRQLYQCIVGGDCDGLQTLLDNGCETSFHLHSFHCQREDEQYEGTSSDSEECVSCDDNVISDTGLTPLIAAAKYKNQEICAMLITKGAKVNMRSTTSQSYIKSESTALHIAAFVNWPHGIKILLKNGANKHITDGNGTTAAEIAVVMDHGDCVETLRD